MAKGGSVVLRPPSPQARARTPILRSGRWIERGPRNIGDNRHGWGRRRGWRTWDYGRERYRRGNFRADIEISPFGVCWIRWIPRPRWQNAVNNPEKTSPNVLPDLITPYLIPYRYTDPIDPCETNALITPSSHVNVRFFSPRKIDVGWKKIEKMYFSLISHPISLFVGRNILCVRDIVSILFTLLFFYHRTFSTSVFRRWCEGETPFSRLHR